MKVNVRSAIYGALIISLSVLIGACKAKVGEKSADDTTAVLVRTDTTATPARTDTGTTAATTTPTMTDANIFAKLDEVNSMEIDAGKMAQQMGSSADVKSFGSMLVTDHTKLKNDGAALAKKLNITPMPPADSADKAVMRQKMEETKMMKGAAFDSDFIMMMIDGHQKTLGNLNTWKGQAQNDSLKNAITQAIPVVQKHLDRAKEIQGKLGGMAASTPGKTGAMKGASSDTSKMGSGKKNGY